MLVKEHFSTRTQFTLESLDTVPTARTSVVKVSKYFFGFQVNRRISPLRAWLCAHASSSLAKFQQLEVTGFHEPIVFQAETPMRKFVAYIDPEDKFTIEDKLSQVSSVALASLCFFKDTIFADGLFFFFLRLRRI